MSSQPSDNQAMPPAAPPAVAPQEQPNEGEPNRAIEWLALYLPAYGTSLLLHLAAGLLAWFLSWNAQPLNAQTHFNYKTGAIVENKVNISKPKESKPKAKLDQSPSSGKPGKPGKPGAPGEKSGGGRGKYKPGPSSISPVFTENPFPDIADNNLQQLEVIGIGGGGNHYGGFEGFGNGRAGFFGTGGEGGEGGEGGGGPSKIIYIVDRSGSMTDSIDYVKMELKRSIGELPDDKEFHVIFYSSGPPLENAPRRLVKATERNKDQVYKFIDDIVAQGETDPSESLRRAFLCQPELIYLLTDGEFDRSIIGLCKSLNTGGKVTIHTIGFLYKSGEAVMRQIADDNNGSYKFVSDKDLEQLRK